MINCRSQLALLATAFSLLIAPSAEAQSSRDGGIDRARELMRAFEYDEAIEILNAVVEAPASPASERIQALELLATVSVHQRNEAQAREAFERLLALDPGHELEDQEIPPQVHSLFSQVQGDHEPDETQGVTIDVEEETPLDSTIARLSASISGALALGVSRLQLGARPRGGGSYERRPMERMGSSYQLEVEVPEAGLEYYIVAEAPSGHQLGQLGTEGEPRQLERALSPPPPPPVEAPVVEQPQRTRWYRSWWFWSLVGLVVVGTTVTAILLARPEQPDEGSMGTLQLPLTR